MQFLNSKFKILNSIRGLTFLELLISIAVITVLAVMGWSGLLRYRQQAELTGSAEEGLSFLLDARTKTLASVEAAQYGVHFESDRMVSFRGATYLFGDPNNRITVLPARVEISSISLNGGGSDVVFERLTGITGQSGTLTFRLKADTAQTRMITVLSTGIVSFGPPQTVSSAGLVGYWTFDEGAGSTAADSSGNGNNGTLTNMDPAGDWVSGKIGSALEFDSGNDHVNIPGSAILDVTGDLTVTLWVKPAVDSSSFHASWNFFIYQRNPLKYEIGYYNTEGPRFKPYNAAGTNFDFSPNLSLSANTWYHMAMVRQGAFLGIYMNGILQDSRSDFTGDLRSSTEVRIGGNGGSSGFEGTIDDVRIYSRRLTDQEIGLLASM